LLLTNRLVLQPLLETEIYGKADPEHRFGAGLATLDLGLRLRYEIRREIASYVGLVSGAASSSGRLNSPKMQAKPPLGRVWPSGFGPGSDEPLRSGTTSEFGVSSAL
jgi:hypothetical protein